MTAYDPISMSILATLTTAALVPAGSAEFMAYIQCNGRTDDRIPHTPAC
jgi:hypothetical protein